MDTKRGQGSGIRDRRVGAPARPPKPAGRKRETIIRPAKFGDIPRIKALATGCWRRSRYADEPMSERRFKEICVSSISEEAACLLVAEVDGVVEGFLIGIIDWIYVFGKNRYATDIMIYVSSKGRGAFRSMIKTFIHWAACLPEKYRVRHIWLASTDAVSDPERTRKMYERLGLRRIGNIFEMRIVP